MKTNTMVLSVNTVLIFGVSLLLLSKVTFILMFEENYTLKIKFLDISNANLHFIFFYNHYRKLFNKKKSFA